MQAKFCSKCGNALREGDKFCRKCGKPIKTPGAPQQRLDAHSGVGASIPSYNAVKESFNNINNNQSKTPYNPEGTVLLGGSSVNAGRGDTIKKAEIMLSLEEMLHGCSKVADFGTGKKYEIIIPAGLSPGDRILVKNKGIFDPDSGKKCDIELTTIMG